MPRERGRCVIARLSFHFRRTITKRGGHHLSGSIWLRSVAEADGGSLTGFSLWQSISPTIVN